jgi:YHS domain-containing protein
VTQGVADVARRGGIRTIPAGDHDISGLEQKVPLWRVESREAPEQRDRDPVCGMAIGDNAVARLVHEGVEYGFCSPACLRRFLEEPERYVSEDRSGKPEL